MNRRGRAVLLLVLLSPSIAELLSSSAPPVEFFNPFGLVIMVTLYGFGSLLIREFRVRRNLGYSAIIFLGMIYGILEEGLAVKSFFSTDWPDLGILAWYGRFLGVNWVWSLALTIYHAVVSIYIPIAVVELLFNDIRDVPWVVSNKKLYGAFAAYLFVIPFFNLLFVGHYHPTILHYIFTLVIIGVLYHFAKNRVIIPFRPFNSPFKSWLVGLIWMLLFYFIYFGLSSSNFPVVIVLLFGVIHSYIGIKYFLGVEYLDVPPNIRMATLLGPPSLFIFLSPLFEFFMERTDDPSGSTFVGIIFGFIFLYFYRRSKKISDVD